MRRRTLARLVLGLAATTLVLIVHQTNRLTQASDHLGSPVFLASQSWRVNNGLPPGIRSWGCNRSETPLIFVHIGKAVSALTSFVVVYVGFRCFSSGGADVCNLANAQGGGHARARFAAAAQNYSAARNGGHSRGSSFASIVSGWPASESISLPRALQMSRILSQRQFKSRQEACP